MSNQKLHERSIDIINETPRMYHLHVLSLSMKSLEILKSNMKNPEVGRNRTELIAI